MTGIQPGHERIVPHVAAWDSSGTVLLPLGGNDPLKVNCENVYLRLLGHQRFAARRSVL